MSIPSTLISGFIGLASCGYMGARILHSLWLIEVDPHRGGSISLRPDIVHRLISACARERRLARGRQHAVFGKDHIKRDRAAVLRFPPHPEMAREPLPQLVPSFLVGGDGQADGGG